MAASPASRAHRCAHGCRGSWRLPAPGLSHAAWSTPLIFKWAGMARESPATTRSTSCSASVRVCASDVLTMSCPSSCEACGNVANHLKDSQPSTSCLVFRSLRCLGRWIDQLCASEAMRYSLLIGIITFTPLSGLAALLNPLINPTVDF